MPLTIHDFRDLEKKGYRFVGPKTMPQPRYATGPRRA